MRVLIIKTSSLGDIIHTFPALTDAVAHHPDLRFDWLVEEGFTDLPALHPAVDNIIALPWRRVRKKLWLPSSWRALSDLKKQLSAVPYDMVIDAQGLLKSAIWTKWVSAPSYGLDDQSARESLASHFYQHRLTVPWGQHAITRVRQLFALAFNYVLADDAPIQYGLTPRLRVLPDASAPAYWVFAHATTWESKHWPEPYWHELIAYAGHCGVRVLIPWGNEQEHARAQRLARLTRHVEVLPLLSLQALSRVLADAALVVGVDTGLTHLAAALHRPVVALYGATEPGLTGVEGPSAVVLQAKFSCTPCLREQCIELSEQYPMPPCYMTDLTPHRVIRAIEGLLAR